MASKTDESYWMTLAIAAYNKLNNISPIAIPLPKYLIKEPEPTLLKKFLSWIPYFVAQDVPRFLIKRFPILFGGMTTGGVWWTAGAAILFTTLVASKSLRTMTYLYKKLRTAKQPRTRIKRDKDDILLIGDGDFPFPNLFFDALLDDAPLSETFIHNALKEHASYKKTYEDDSIMFSFLFMPVATRQEKFPESQRKFYIKKLRDMGYTNVSKVNLILRRVSEYDILKRPDIVKEAASTSGVNRTGVWKKKYLKLRGFRV